MKFETKRIVNALSTIRKMIPKGTVNFRYSLFEMQDNYLGISYYNGGSYVKFWLEGEGIGEGSIGLEINTLLRASSAFQDYIELEIDKNNLLKVRSGNFEGGLRGVFVEDVLIPKKEEEQESLFKISKEELKQGLNWALLGCDPKTEIAIRGEVGIEIEEGSVNFLGVDGFKLVKYQGEAETLIKHRLGVQASYLEPLLYYITVEKGDCNFLASKSNNMLYFKTHDFTYGAVIRSDYFDYRNVFPNEYIGSIKVEKGILVEAFDVAQALTGMNECGIIWEFKDGDTYITLRDDNKGEKSFRHTVLGETTLKDFRISFNVALIRKIIAKMKGNLIWEFSGKHSPIKITQEDESKILVLLMPMKLEEGN